MKNINCGQCKRECDIKAKVNERNPPPHRTRQLYLKALKFHRNVFYSSISVFFLVLDLRRSNLFEAKSL